jgi:hypothetical protein
VRTLQGKSRIRKNARSVFQDHRHRPLGHPSASKYGLNLGVSLLSLLANRLVSPEV